MGKQASPDTLALDKQDQKKHVKSIKKIKRSLQSGQISIKEERKDQKEKAEEKRGLVYIGHLPHGFYESQLKSYFQQFGKVTNVKLSRSSRTGNSKGFGYVEFAHAEVAKIAAETMNNYLMFKKRIVAEYVPFEKRPKSLFYDKRNTLIPPILRRRQRQAATKNKIIPTEKLNKQSKTRTKKLEKKMEKLEKYEIDYIYKAKNTNFNSSHLDFAGELGEDKIFEAGDNKSKSLTDLQFLKVPKLRTKRSKAVSENLSPTKLKTESLPNLFESTKSIKKVKVSPVKKQTKTITKKKNIALLDKAGIKKIAKELINDAKKIKKTSKMTMRKVKKEQLK